MRARTLTLFGLAAALVGAVGCQWRRRRKASVTAPVAETVVPVRL